MSKIALSGNASGTGTFTIASPNSNSNYQLDLPAESGTIITTASTTGISASALSTGTIPKARMYAGAVLQVVTGTSTTNVTTSGTTLIATGITATITPTSTTSKILILGSIPTLTTSTGTSASIRLALYKNGVSLISDASANGASSGGDTAYVQFVTRAAFNYIDTPATTSATTYAFYFSLGSAGTSCGVMTGGNLGQITLIEVAV